MISVYRSAGRRVFDVYLFDKILFSVSDGDIEKKNLKARALFVIWEVNNASH